MVFHNFYCRETLKPNSSHIPSQAVVMDISSDLTYHEYPTSEGKIARKNEQAVKNADGISNYRSKREIDSTQNEPLDDFKFKSAAEIGGKALNGTVGVTEVICRNTNQTTDNC